MEDILDSDFVLYKAMSEKVIMGLEKSLKLFESKCEAIAAQFDKVRNKYMTCETYDDVGKVSKMLQQKQDQLLKELSVRDRIEKIIKRNEQRLSYYNSKLEAMGIYNYQVDKKSISDLISKEEKNISEKSLNLNPNKNENISLKYFEGKILAFKNNRLDLSLDENEGVLNTADSAFFHSLVETFPYAVATIPDEYYLISNVKYNILRECILYVAQKSKMQKISKSNKELGGLLENSESISDVFEYAKELRNYLNVTVKQCIKKNEPEMSDEVDANLKCNEASEFLPRSKRVAVLVNGIAGETQKSEVEENEEIRKEQEEEAQKTVTREQLLDLLLADEEEELEEIIESVETTKKAEEERKSIERKEKEEEIKELEEELAMGLKKTGVVDS